MKKLAALIAILFTLSCAGARLTPRPVDDIGQLYASVGLVEIVDRSGNSMVSGTAFAYDKDLLLTANHLCIAAIEIQALTTHVPSIIITYTDSRGRSHIIDDIAIASMSPVDDICALRSTNHGMRPVVLAEDNSLKVRDEVTIIGAPLGLVIGEWHGHVLSLKLKNNHPMLMNRLIITAASAGGSSGAPIFSRGRLVGLLVAGVPSFPNLSICLTLEQIKRFLVESGIKT